MSLRLSLCDRMSVRPMLRGFQEKPLAKCSVQHESYTDQTFRKASLISPSVLPSWSIGNPPMTWGVMRVTSSEHSKDVFVNRGEGEIDFQVGLGGVGQLTPLASDVTRKAGCPLKYHQCLVPKNHCQCSAISVRRYSEIDRYLIHLSTMSPHRQRSYPTLLSPSTSGPSPSAALPPSSNPTLPVSLGQDGRLLLE
jgi:hypothetical protein